MDPIRKIPKKFTKKFGNKVINRQYFHRKTGLESQQKRLCWIFNVRLSMSLFLETPNSQVHSSSIERLPKKHFKTLHESVFFINIYCCKTTVIGGPDRIKFRFCWFLGLGNSLACIKMYWVYCKSFLGVKTT